MRATRATTIACVCIGFLLYAATAFATGGATIAAAPAVTFGQQEFGNTATDSSSSQSICHAAAEMDSWWLVPAIAGDQLTIDFAGSGVEYATVYPVGTTDYNVTDTSDVAQAEIGSNGAQQLVVKTDRDGTFPLDFSTTNCDFGGSATPGPYNFTAYVSHEIVLALTAVAHPRSHSTAFKAAVHNPDGLPLTNPVLRASFRQIAGHKTTSLATVAAPFAFVRKWPKRLRGAKQTIRVTVTGPGYRPASKAMTVRAQ